MVSKHRGIDATQRILQAAAAAQGAARRELNMVRRRTPVAEAQESVWSARGTAAALLACLILACAGASPAGDVPSPLRVGMATNYPPLAFKENGQLAGVEADFAHRLGPALGVTVTLVETAWEDLIPALRDRRIDVIMSGMSITEDRKALVSFTDSYFTIGQMAVVRAADAARLRDPAAMDQPSVRVGTVTATTGERYARASLPHATLSTYPSVDAAIDALRAGQIDVFIHDAPAIWHVRGRPLLSDRELHGLYTPRTEEPLAWAVRNDNDALRERLNAVLQRWKADGQIDTVLNRWMPVRKYSIPLPPSQ
jgi:polar amino acid transport system substrate-binding protein